MENFDVNDLKKLSVSAPASHKGQNGKLIIIGGSHLFHGASLWALKVATRIVDMVFYSSIPENNQLAEKLKSEIYDFIAVPREKINDYINEADAILLGPGLPREEGREEGDPSTKELVQKLLNSYPGKRWILDAGALQTVEPVWLKKLKGNVILTPHHKEFERLFGNVILSEAKNLNKIQDPSIVSPSQDDIIREIARKYNCVILLKGQEDIVCPPRLGEAGSPSECVKVEGGNAGMTKGGTGDVLSGLVAALACKNDLFLAAKCASFINKKAGEELYKRVGIYFNASDLADEIPKVMNHLINQ